MSDTFRLKAIICMVFIFFAFAIPLTGCDRGAVATQHDNGAFLIASDSNATGYTRFSMNSGGYALLVWRHWESGPESLRGVYYDPDAGWSDQTVINPSSSIANEVVIDENNDCFAVWEDGHTVGTSRYDAASSWGSVSSIPTGSTGYVSQPVVAAGPQGTAFAIWMEYQYSSMADTLWVSSYETGTGWTAAQPVQDVPNIGFGSYTIAVDGSGNALAVWTQFVLYSGVYEVLARRYEAGVGWGPVETLMSDDDAYPPQVAFDATGNALVVWGDIYNSARRIVSRSYSVSSGWAPLDTIIEVPVDTDIIYEVHLAMNPGGDAVLVWMRPTNAVGFDIWTDRYVVGSGWTKSPVRISDGTTDSQYPAVAIDPAGNAVAIWRQDYATRLSIAGARYSADTGWSAPKIISTDRDNVWADNASVAIDAKSNVLAVWQETEQNGLSFWGNRFDK